MTRVAALTALFLTSSALAQAPHAAWERQYNGPANHQDEPTRLAVGVGGLFVGGRSYSQATADDFSLLKYSPRGELVWSRHYDGPGHGGERVSDVLLDGEGGAYICGYSHSGSGWQAALLHYSAAGDLLWVRTVPTPGLILLDFGPRLARTPAGGLRMAMTSDANFLVAAFDGAGNQLWTREMDIDDEDFLTGLAVDAEGNTVVAGPVGSGFGGFETVMLDPVGNVLWSDSEFGEFGSTLGGAIVAIDADGEVVVSAVPESNCGVFQVRTWRLSPDGVRLWTRAFPEGRCDSADLADMQLDRDGNAVVLCESAINADGGWYNFTTLKYDADGNEVWRRTVPSAGVDIPTALDIDRAGNIYVTGAADLNDDNTFDALAASYSPDGALRWTKVLDKGAINDRPADIVVGQRGEVYLSGMSFFQATNDDIVTVKLQQASQLATPIRR